MSRLSLRLLGGFEAQVDGARSLPLAGKKIHALLAYLAMRPGQACLREKLMALLWGDSPEPQARHSLSQALFALRRWLGPCASCLVVETRTLALDASAIDVDVARFERLVSDGTAAALEEAAALYTGDLLEGLDVDEAPFEEWLIAERERLRERGVEALARLLAHQMKHDLVADATQNAVRLLALDPLQEPVHRTLMRLYVRQGRRAAALRQYQVCVGILRRELGVDPEQETRELYQGILRREHGRLAPAEARSARPAPGRAQAGPGGAGRRLAATHETPLVGRGAERTRLHEALAGMSSESGQVLLVVGEAGIGKSRLVEDLAAEALDHGHRVLFARSHETEQVLPLRPWVDALREGRIVSEIERLEGLALPWRRELGRLFPELPDPGLVRAVTRDDHVRLFEAVTALLGEVAKRGPVTLVLDDLHWADDMTVRLFSFLGRRIGGHPILLAGTARGEDAADRPVLRALFEEFEREPRWVRLALGPLSMPETSALVASMAPAGSPGPALERLATRVWRASEGNPFVIMEMMRAFQQAQPADEATAIALPPRVRDVISSRLDRLSEIGRQVCAAAAVIGEPFTFPLLADVAGLEEAATARAVEELVRRNVLAAVGERFHFVHERIREVVYDGLLTPARRSLHAAVARAMEGRWAERLEEVYDRLAHHYSKAEDAARAITYLVCCAGQASRRYALADTVRSLDQALALVDAMPAAERERRGPEITIRKAEALSALGRFRDILDLLLPLRARVDALGQAEVAGVYHSRLALTHSYLGNQALAGEAARRAIEAARRCGDDVTAGHSFYVLSVRSFWLGEPRAGVEHGREAVAVLSRTLALDALGAAHWMLGLNHLFLGEFDQALAAEAEVDVIGRSMGDPRLQARAAQARGWIHAARGDWDRAVEDCQSSLSMARDPFTEVVARAYVGYAYLEKGEAASALPLLEESMERLRRMEARQSAGRVAVFLAEACRLAGGLDRARDLAAATRATSADVGDRWGHAWATRALGRIALAAGDPAEATRLLEEALAIFTAVPARFETARTSLDLATLASARGDADGATRLVAAAHQVFTELGAPRYVERAERVA
ncbi:MAG: ATP-binding protein, partial [Candidatus Rokuibacteriota bacterium]